MKRLFIVLILVVGPTGSGFAKSASPTPTHANVAYDTHERTVLDFWQAEGEGPRPLLVYIHGGGWVKGDKRSMRNAGVYLEKGISVASIHYRLTPTDPLPAPVHDAARAVQFLRSKASAWNIDKDNMVLAGGSAGGCSALWIACHDDLAKPDSRDPVERESTRVQGAGVVSAQTSIDPKVIEPWIGPKVFLAMIYKAVGEDSLEAMQQNYAKHEAVFEEFSPINHLSQDDPPLFLEYAPKPEFMALPATSFNYGIHHGLFGIKMKQRSVAVGHNQVDLYIKDHDESDAYANADDFIIQTLLGEQTAAATVAHPSTVIPVKSRLKKFMPSLHEEKLEEVKTGNIDFVMIGDSITHAWSRYPDAFKNMKLLNLGFPGDRTQNVLWRIQHGALDGISPRLVTLMIGTNHAHPPKKHYVPDTPEDIFTGIQAVVAEVRTRLPESKLVVLSIFPRKPGSANDRVMAVNAMLPKLADQEHVFHVDINSIFLDEHGVQKTALYHRDRLHLNPTGYAAWAEALLPILQQEGLKTNLNALAHPASKQGPFPGKLEDWNGFDMYVDGGNRVVVPKVVADGKPWVWRARFWGHEPQFDIAMLERGYHVVYCHVGNLLGNAEAVKRWDEFYNYLRFEHLFADRVVLEGMSRGGLIIYNWAAANPDKVAAIYGDAPVMDFKSWPGINEQILARYGFTDQQEAEAYALNPVDNLAALAKAGVPIIHVVGDADEVVPVAENTAIAEARYKAMGGTFKVIHKQGGGHHPHSLQDPTPIVEFVMEHDRGQGDLPADKVVSDRNFLLRGDYRNSRIQFERNRQGHVAFLGGSITEMDGYRPMVCEMLETRFPDTEFTFTEAGVSSTCSDTGAFRLQHDVLSQGPLDMLFVEFAVNDDQDGQRRTYDDALRGMEGIIAQARRHNPEVDIVMTFFVNQPILQALQDGKTRSSITAHSKVAEHYGVSVNHLAQELADLITTGKMDWRKFGGVHPNTYGNTMCATMIATALLKEWSKPLPVDAEPQPYPVQEPMDDKSYIRGRFLPFDDVTTDENWTVGVPNWAKESQGKVRPRFIDIPIMYSSQAGAKLSIDFTGTAIGAYLLAGPETGIIRCTVDEQHSKEIDTLYPYSGFNYPVTLIFFNDLEEGAHRLELEVLENRPGRIKPGGSALRVIGFTAN